MLTAAIPPAEPARAIILQTGLGSDTGHVYVNMYFAEPSTLSPKNKRSFAVFVDGDQVGDPIVPDYASVQQFTINGTVSGSTELPLQATSDATSPPMINAMEVFYVSGPRNSGTDENDGKINGYSINFEPSYYTTYI